MAHLEGSFEQVNHRLGALEQRVGNVERKIDDRFDRIDCRFARLESRFERRFTFVYGLIVVSILIPLVTRFAFH